MHKIYYNKYIKCCLEIQLKFLFNHFKKIRNKSAQRRKKKRYLTVPTSTRTAADAFAVSSGWHLNVSPSLCTSWCLRVPLTIGKKPLCYLLTHVLYLPVLLRDPERVQWEDECSRQCTIVDKWILLSLLHNWTGTCNVSQSFNSNLPWPVVGYIIINHPCQSVQRNCWVEAINR